MDRRRFLCGLTAAGTAASFEIGCGSPTPTRGDAFANARVTYQVKGFTCITCAVGLETMLRAVRGVAEASASYERKTVTIAFDDRATGEDALKQFISDCGFSIAG
jgi:Cu+-exporting ATPase